MADAQKYQADLDRLIEIGNTLLEALDAIGAGERDIVPILTRDSQQWDTEASRFIEQVLHERSGEFKEMYSGDKDSSMPFILDIVHDGYDPAGINLRKASRRLTTQFHILESAKAAFTSSLFNITAVLQADLFDSELDAARELLGKGFLRPAGIVAGVVLERHLAQVAANHGLTTRKRRPTMSDFNDLLKNNSVVDVPDWRQIQRLGDIRNLCAHSKEREPTKDEVTELIDGVAKYTKRLS